MLIDVFFAFLKFTITSGILLRFRSTLANLWIYRQKFYKLKKESEKLLVEGAATVDTGETTTPAKAKSPKRSGGGKRKSDAAADGDGEEDATPTKRKRNTKKPAPKPAPKVKTEEVDAESGAENGANGEEQEAPAVKNEDAEVNDKDE